MFEKARAVLTELKNKAPENQKRLFYKDVVEELSEVILENIQAGHSLTVITKAINDAEGTKMKERTLREYLRFYKPKKKKRTAAKRQQADDNAAAPDKPQSKPKKKEDVPADGHEETMTHTEPASGKDPMEALRKADSGAGDNGDGGFDVSMEGF